MPPSPPRLAADPSPRLYPRLLAGACALIIAMGIGRFAFTPILPVMQGAAGFGDDGAGFLASINYIGYLAGVMAAGAVPVRRATGLFRLSLIASVVTTAAMAATGSFAIWAGLRLIAGVASGMTFVLASGMVLETLSRRGRPTLSGYHFGGVGVGIALSGVTVTLVPAALGWRGDWAVLGILCVVLAVPCWRHLTAAPAAIPAAAPVAGPGPDGKAAVPPGAGRRLGLITAAYFLEGLSYIISGTFMVALIGRQPAMAEWGNLAWIIVGIVAAPSAVAWSAWGKRTGVLPALALAYLLQAAGTALPLLGGAAAAVGAAVTFGGTFMAITSLTLTAAMGLSPRHPGTLSAALTAIYGVGQILGPIIAGHIATMTGGFTLPMIGAAAATAVAGVLVVSASFRTVAALVIPVR